ncbi:MAG TPA: CAAX prenyl protease-related protein, partial [Isosphaeraceae bacterium]|nr:CAAX prenyl protease-related protein [Isosphaeraceae bacterium]
MSSPSEVETTPSTGAYSRPAWLPYVMPMAAFLVLTTLEGQLPSKKGQIDAFWYPIAYALKVAVVLVVTWLCRSTWKDLRPWPGMPAMVAAVGIGLLVLVLWVGLDKYYPRFDVQGSRSAFDPSRLSDSGRWAFLAVRFFGLVALVPLIEELFWRSFLIRYIMNPDFWTVPIG